MPITATAEPGNVPPRVLLTVTGLTDATTTITRQDPDGRSQPVRSAEPAALASGTWTGYDYEAPLNTPVTYTSTPPTNAVEVSAPVTVTSSALWLMHPGVPDVSLQIPLERVTGLDPRERAARSATLQPLGRNTPVVVSEHRATVTTGLTVVTDTLDERDAMWSVLSTGSPLLLNIPASLNWGVTREYISVGDVSEGYLARGLSTGRVWSLPYTVVDRPVGALTAQWSYAGVLTGYGTYGQVLTAYDTYTDVLTNSAT